MAQTYYFLVASDHFLQGHQTQEVLEERTRHYLAQGKAIDFWWVRSPAFLDAPQLADIRRRCPSPAAAVVSTDGQFVLWLKHRLQYVLMGQFEAPSAAIPDPLAAHTAAR
ncbi:MgPME-cyclase complex family protein [Gloeobacter morelensis]|uniref:DUF2488 family protein n=1 Tax=Gloeobacter morelensis MG652769 TaxID=2781736 RepID=A0ABY3PQY2_9CYAN|nr:MgPME-cyclase complex family protein [Gloeobacter morelensis]UFP96098.1 DUF2488 family protein [Gloeobacter morelensis MG652769]